jgi:transcription antitermination factor NusG
MRLRKLFEAQIQPGQRKGFSLQLKRIEDIQLKVAGIQSTISQLGGVDVPDVLKKQMEDLITAAKIEKEKIYAEISDKSAKNPIIQGIPMSVLKLFKGIEKNASTIMNAYRKTGKFLYRGISSSDDALYGKPFDQRRAKDSNPELINALNQSLADQGFAARRDNTTFTTSGIGHAGNYGLPYIIFPRDGFSFHYSKEIRDLVLDTTKLYLLVDSDIREYIESIVYGNWGKLKPYFSHRFTGDTLFKDYEYKRDLDGIQNAVANGALPPEFAKYKSLADLVDSKKVIDNFRYDQSDLDGAINSAHEVMVTGPYYAVRNDRFEKYLTKYIELTKSGTFDITPDTKSEKDKFNKSIDAVIGSSDTDFEKGSWVEHKYEKIKGIVVDTYHTNDFIQIKNYTGKLLIVNKKNLNKIETPEIPDYKVGDKVYLRTNDTEWEYYNDKKFKVEDVDELTVTVRSDSGKAIIVPKLLTEPSPKYDTNDPMIGDTVHITDGQYKDLYATIAWVSKYSKDIEVDLGDGNQQIMVDKGKYEVIDPATKPKSPLLLVAFEKGDYVKIADDMGEYSNVVGVAGKPGIVTTEVTAFDGYGYQLTVKNSRLKKINKDEYEKQSFALYDTVKIIGGKHDGEVGEYSYLYSNGFLEIRTTDGKTFSVPAKYVFKLTNTQAISKGDFVKISEFSSIFPGTVATVTGNASKGESPVLIYGNTDYDYTIDTKLLTKISEEEFNKGAFKKGDQVKVTAGPYAGKVGTVDKLSYFQHIVVKIDDSTYSIDPDSLEVILKPSNKTDDDLIDLDFIDFEAEDEPTPPKKNTATSPDIKKKFDELSELGKKQGYVTFNDINDLIKSLPEEFNTSEQVNNIMLMLAELGINVSPGSSSINTPQELQARVNDPDVKADLKEILKNSTIKEKIQKAIKNKIMWLDDSLEIYNKVGNNKWEDTVLPYLELKGVKIR